MIRKIWSVLIGLALMAGLSTSPVLSAPAHLPDLIVDQWYFYCCGEPFVDSLTFAPDHCAVAEGYVPAGTHKLLRFSTVVANVGNADIMLGRPKTNDPNWIFSPCHQHWHFVPFAIYRLLDSNGVEVGVGHKQAFCLEDGNPYDSTYKVPRLQYTCAHQGLSYNWEDAYFSYLGGQWIVIDDVAAGTYTLSVTVNYLGVLPESNYNNNTATVQVTIP